MSLRLRQTGKVRFVGITGYPLDQFKYVLERTSVKVDIVLSYCRCTLIDRSLDSMFPFFESEGVCAP